MWPTSELFKRTIADSHAVVTRVEVLQDNLVIADLTSMGVVADGSVTANRSSIMRTARLTLTDEGGQLTPRDTDDLLLPAGNEIRLWRGVRFPGARSEAASEELVPLGTFRFIRTDIERNVITFDQMYDRAWKMAGDRLESVTTIAAGTLYTTAIETLLKLTAPTVLVNFPITDEVTPLMIFEPGLDVWEVCQTLAANLGMILYFDPMGVCTMRDEPEPSEEAAVWAFDDHTVLFTGRYDVARQNMLLDGFKTSWFGDTYNAFVVIGESSSMAAPVIARAYDLNPKSPTKYGGKYGKRMAPEIRDEKITSLALATARANKELKAYSGLFMQHNMPSLVNPALEPIDVVYVDVDGYRDYHVLDDIETPLRVGQHQTLDTRLRQVTFG